jgi:hypothetical protein
MQDVVVGALNDVYGYPKISQKLYGYQKHRLVGLNTVFTADIIAATFCVSIQTRKAWTFNVDKPFLFLRSKRANSRSLRHLWSSFLFISLAGYLLNFFLNFTIPIKPVSKKSMVESSETGTDSFIQQLLNVVEPAIYPIKKLASLFHYNPVIL